MKYKKTGSKFKKKYGKNLSELSDELKISLATLSSWDRQGFDIFYKANELNASKGNKRLQKLWQNLKSRCGNPNDKKYKFYGGKGIKIKISKHDLSILWDRDEAAKLKQPSLDRLDSSKDYEFPNCRFIEMVENRNRAIHLKRKTKTEKLTHIGICIDDVTVGQIETLRTKYGWSRRKVLTLALKHYLKLRGVRK